MLKSVHQLYCLHKKLAFEHKLGLKAAKRYFAITRLLKLLPQLGKQCFTNDWWDFRSRKNYHMRHRNTFLALPLPSFRREVRGIYTEVLALSMVFVFQNTSLI
jgi:hypothetical protein